MVMMLALRIRPCHSLSCRRRRPAPCFPCTALARAHTSAFSPRAHADGEGVPRLKALLKERLAALREIASAASEAFRSGRAPLVPLIEASQDVYRAELDLCDTDKERAAVLGRWLAEARGYERKAAELVKAGAAPATSALKTKVIRLEVEIALERVKAR
jgi:hypothetical protein